MTENKQELLKKIDDMCILAYRSNVAKFSFFLNEQEISLAESFLAKKKEITYDFFGGAENTKRKVLAIYPSNFYIELDFYGVKVLVTKIPKMADVKHSDVLGSLMSLNIKRELIGDIIIDNDNHKILVFSHKNATEIILSEMKKIKNFGTDFSIKENADEIVIEDKFEELTTTVSSMRIDSVVSVIAKTNRNSADKLIEQQKVTVNYDKNFKKHRCLKENDVISIQKYGKFKIVSCLEKTKKDKHILIYKKYN